MFGGTFIHLKWKNQDVLATFCTAIFSVFWCADVVLLMSSTSGTQSTNVINDALPSVGCLSTGVVENTTPKNTRAAADDVETVVPNFLNDALPDGGSLSMGVVAYAKINEAQTAADSAVLVAPNVLNDALPSSGGLYM